MQPPEIDFSRFNQMFLDEAADLIQVLESGLLDLKSNPAEPELYHAIFRAAHSIKGNAGMTGWETVANFTHVLEGVLDELRSNRRPFTSQLVDQLLSAVDHLQNLLARKPTDPLTQEEEQCLQNLRPSSEPPATASTDHTTAQGHFQDYEINWTPPTDALIRGAEPLRILAAIKATAEIRRVLCHTAALPPLPELTPQHCHLSWTLQIRTQASIEEIHEIFALQTVEEALTIQQLQNEEPDAPAPKTNPTTSATSTDTIRITAQKLDAIFNLVGEMVITQSMAIQTMETLREQQPEIDTTLQELKRQTRELQDRVMGLRLVPLDQVFRRFPRLVHDLSQQLGKPMDLEITGAETEIDRAIVEQIGDPLIHLIRNCADHGIESKLDRERNGKPPSGKIHLHARCQGGNTIVEIQDDGRGLDLERIRTKALQLNLIQPNTKYSEKQLQSLIFHPGFSTADQVTAISGRGVGMDAVRRSIEALSGSIAVQTKPGKGSQFTIHLPMTVAILDGLLIRIADNLIVLPLASISECIRLKSTQLRTLPTEIPQVHKEILLNRDRILPVLRLHRLFGIAETQTPSKPMAILIEHNGAQFAILADEILGKSQVVIKSLETNYRRVEGLQGATILGDGRVALVADLAALTRIHERLEEQTLQPEIQVTERYQECNP